MVKGFLADTPKGRLGLFDVNEKMRCAAHATSGSSGLCLLLYETWCDDSWATLTMVYPTPVEEGMPAPSDGPLKSPEYQNPGC